MDLLLREEAGRAQDIAEILSTIRSNDQDHEQDITLAITGLNGLSWALRELNNQIDAVNGKVTPAFAGDLKLLQHSVAFTLQDVWTILGKLPRAPVATDYQDCWKEVARYCMNMGKQTLHTRLETYKLFTYSLCKILSRESFNRRRLEDLRLEIYDLQTLQREDRRLIPASETFTSLSLVPVQQVIRPLPSHERVRPEPVRPEPVRPEPLRPEPQRPMSPATSHDSYETFQHQAAPSPPPLSPVSPGPGSPVTTFSTLSHTSSVDPETNHWATKIFNNLPSTPLDVDPNPSCCFGDVDARYRRRPDPEYERILQLKFPGGLRTKYFWRARDYRTKIVCEWYDNRKNPRLSCFPLSELHIRRSGSSLYLCCPTVRGASTCWTSLNFTSYEWLVIFHCTFLSLRSHDSTSRFRNIDHDLDGEVLNFAGAIRDGGYRHVLRLYRDKGTDAVRLEASVLDKEMKDTPIWTAFITHKITSPTWFRWSKNSSTVYLAELQRHVFSSEYSPHVRANGEHLLDFEVFTDAEDFVKTLKDLREDIRRPKPVKNVRLPA
ncbi:uncharacterized protein A1O5_02171 [Cladophialophora psammophila CBS 110553]|uniref:Uncharacterized protein n=1 Tax=Cladophialophora psammophila CBS 110553 TaxID=1182543 RepID=W9XDS2_9EURO|nr:uncharacterized protein A1O5_02171 [Cladophialophora psammophila CBS 110553]EXJ75475.1 hypothetical protein A1O5_02171 [Cladophialophora psammophila CBS 110553]